MSELMTEDDTNGLSDDLQSVGALSPKEPSKNAKRNRKKVTAEWTDESTLNLIASVESQDFLWNAGHKDYKNRTLRNKVWQEMSENIFHKEYDAAELQAKWSNLRIQFKSYHTKAKQTKSGQAAKDNTVSWKYYSHMMFVAAAEDEQATESESNLVSTNHIFLS